MRMRATSWSIQLIRIIGYLEGMIPCCTRPASYFERTV